MKKFIILFIIFYLALIAFMPKENLYYTLKNRLKSERITLSEENLSDNFILLKGDELLIYYDGIASVAVDKFSVMALGLYNKIEAYNVAPAKDLKSMFNFSADSVKITYAVWDYKSVNIYAEGDFGVINGVFNPLTQMLKVELEPSAAFEKSSVIRQYFKKSDEGYSYESKIQ